MTSVAIEIAPPSQSDVTPPALARALVDACATAMHEGSCALDSDPVKAPPTAVAIVRWDADEKHVHIEVGKKDREESAWQNRELDFGDEDQRVERWRTVGLTIATLAGELTRAEAVPARSEPSLEPPHPSPRREPARDDRKSANARGANLWVDAGGLVGTGLDTGAARLGVWANVGVRLGRSRFVGLGSVDFATAETSPSLSVQWLSGAAGLGVDIGGAEGPLLEPSIAIDVERVRATVSASDGTDSGSELEFGVRANAIFVWQLGLLSPLIGLRGWLDAEPIRILVHRQYAGTAPSPGGLAFLGVRIRLE